MWFCQAYYNFREPCWFAWFDVSTLMPLRLFHFNATKSTKAKMNQFCSPKRMCNASHFNTQMPNVRNFPGKIHTTPLHYLLLLISMFVAFSSSIVLDIFAHCIGSPYCQPMFQKWIRQTMFLRFVLHFFISNRPWVLFQEKCWPLGIPWSSYHMLSAYLIPTRFDFRAVRLIRMANIYCLLL